MEKALMKMVKDLTDAAITHPGAGAQRAIAVLGTLGANKSVPWDRLAKFKVDWVSRTKDDALCPEINMEFHPKDDIVVIADGYGKVVIDDDVHIRTNCQVLDDETTLCGLKLNEANFLHTERLGVTCAACLAKVGI